MTTKTQATVDDLYHVPENGKAEIVNGELVLMSPTGSVLGRAAGEIFISLREYERRVGGGYAFPDNVGFMSIFLTDVLLAPTPHSSKESYVAGSSLKVRRSLLLRSEATKTMDQQQKFKWLQSE